MTYDPIIGRWLEEDPIGLDAGDMNLYRMEGNNPTNEVDPSGEGAVSAAAKTIWNTGVALITGEEPPPEFRILAAASNVVIKNSNLPDVTQLYKAPARAFWEWVADAQMQAKGLSFAAQMLKHSLQDSPKNLVLPTTHFATVKMRSSKEYKDLIAEIVKNAPCEKSTGTRTIEFKGGHGVDSEDLFATAHNADVQYSITKLDNDNYEVQVKIKDRYNFERHLTKYYSYGNMKAWAGANAAWFNQFYMIINGFDWETAWLTEKQGDIKK